MNIVFTVAFYFILLLGNNRAYATPEPVSQVELNRYTGRWFEIARIPNEFQDNELSGYGPCTGTIAEYASSVSNRIDVRNSCTRTNPTGDSKQEVALGVARVIDDSRGARLKVNFTGIAFLRWLGIGDGDYWILGLGPINEEGLYSWALVGSPKLDYGWVLARRPSISEVEFDEILRLGEHQGYKRGQFKQ